MEETNKPTRKINSRAIIAVGFTCILGWAFAYLATNVFREYAFGLFVWLPLVMGATSTLIYGYHNTSERHRLFNISIATLIIFCLGLLFFAWEGIICLFMALPIGLFFTWLGHFIGYNIIKSKIGNTPTTIIIFFLSVPSLMAFEKVKQDKEEIRSVVTSIEINASPEQVWKNVIAFPQLKDPTEFIFKTGIAYPINATISGDGSRRCKTLQFFNRQFCRTNNGMGRATTFKILSG
jgi:hypothetical protein